MAKKIILHGDVGSEIVASQLEKELRVANGEDVVLHIHSYGGSVFEGLAVITTLEQYSGKVDVVCDGICASMASVIAMVGRNIRMSEHGYMMIHAPSTATFGNKVNHQQSAILLGQLEETMQKLYAKRIQDQSTLELLMNGEDHWFTATDAMKIGLIDGIIRSEHEAKNEKNVVMQRCREVWAKYNDLTSHDETKEPTPDAKLLAMWKNKADLAEKEAQKLKNELDTIRKNRVEEMIDKAIDSKKIYYNERDVLLKIADKGGIDVLAELLQTMKPRVSIYAQLYGGYDKVENRNTWNWDKWQLEDPRGLEAMQKNNNSKFKKLFEEKFSTI